MDKGRFAKVTERKLELGIILVTAVVLGLGVTSGSLLSSGNSGDLVADYRFDNGAGSTAYDTTGNNDGTIDGASWTEGVDDKALSFDGSDDYVDISSGFDFGPNEDFTLSAWVKTEEDRSGHHTVVGSWSSNNNHRSITVYSGDIMAQIGDSDTYQRLRRNTGFNNGKWHHVAAVYDRSDNMELYVDGNKEGATDISSIGYTGRDGFGIGGKEGGGNNLAGKIDNVKIYSRDLDESQIKSLYNSGSWKVGSKDSSVRFKKSEGFELYSLNEPINGEKGWEYGSSCSSSGCVVDQRSEDGTRGFKQADGGGDLYADSLTYSFERPLNGEVVIEGEYWEKSSPNWDGNFWVKDCDGSNMAGIGTENPQFEADINNSQAYLNNPSAGYQDWVNVKMKINTDTGEADFYWEQDNTGASDSYTGSVGANREICEFGVGPGGTWYIDDISIRQGKSKVLDMSFSDQNSSHVFDTSGQKNHGEPQNGASQETAGGCKVGRCYSFDESGGGGTGQFVESDPASGLSNREITAMAWIKPKPSTDSRAPIIRADQFYFQHYSDDRLATYWYGWDKTGYHTSSSNSVPTGKWSHVAVTWDEKRGVTFYINGQKDNQVSNSGPGDPNSWIKIGQESSGRRFNGEIDQAKVFNRSLSQQEIIKEAEGLKSEGAVLDLRFNDGGGDLARDTSSKQNNGRLYNNPNWSKGVQNGGLKLDGNNDHIGISDTESLKYKGGEMTVSGWYYETGDTSGEIVSKPWNGNGDYNYKIGKTASDELRLHVNGDDTIKEITSGSLTSGRWHHFTAVLNNPDYKLYVDGDLEASGTKSISAWVPSDNGDSNKKLSIGTLYPYGEGWSGDTTHAHEGKIDELKLYPYALSKNEMKDLYTQGSTKVGGDLPSSCSSLKGDKRSGEYRIDPNGGDTSDSFKVYCEMEENGGGWAKLWFKKDQTNGYGFVSCESKWSGKWSSNPVLDIDPDCDAAMEEDWHDLDYYDAKGNPIPDRQIEAFASQDTKTVYDGSFHFYDPDSNCDGGRYPVTGYNNSGPGGNSLNIFPTMGSPAVDTTHVFCGGSNSDPLTVSGTWRTIQEGGVPTAFGLQSGTGDTGCWNCGGYDEGLGSTIELKQTYFWVKGSGSEKPDLVLDQSFDRVEKCGQSDTISCPSGTSGKVAVDESGEENHGELVNGPTEKASGECKIGSCLKVPDSSDRVDIPNNEGELNLAGDVTISSWVRIPDPEARWTEIISQEGSDAGFRYYTHSNGGIRIYSRNGTDSGDCNHGGPRPDPGEWIHVVAVFDDSSGTWSLYGDGKLHRSDTDGACDTQFAADEPIQLSVDGFNGSLDQVRVYNRSLSKNEIWNLYTKDRDRSSEGVVAGPAGRWDFSSEYGREVYDRAGEGNTGDWNSNGPATEKRYVVNHYHAGRGLSVSAYENNTEINAGSCTKTLNRGDTKTFSAGCYSVADSVESEKPFSAHFQAGGSDGPVPESFAGREFVYEDCRDTDYFNIVSPYNSASVSVKNASGTIMSTTVSQGGHKEINPNIEQGDEYTIESDSKILVSYDRSMGDTYMMHPASDNVWGLIEDLIVSKDNTQVTVYDSDGNTVTDTVYNKYDRIGLSQGGSQGGSESHRAVANKSALGGSRCADADNGELDIAISNNEMSKEFRLPEPVAGAGNNVGDYYVSLTTSDQATCSVYHRNGTLAAEKSSGQSSPYPGFITFDTTYDFNLTEKGARVSCTEPSAMQWEPSDYEGESNLYGVDTRPEGKTGKALDLDGKEDYVDISSATWSNYFGSSANQDTWTTTAWVKVDNLNKGYNDGTAGAIIGQRYGTTTVPLGVREDGSLFVDLDDSRSASPESTGTIEEDKWYHVAASYSWSDDLSSTPYGKAEFYINGKHAGTDTNDNDDGASTSSELYLGKDARYDMHLDGKIDDVRIYPYALNKGQVQQVMNGGGVGVGS